VYVELDDASVETWMDVILSNNEQRMIKFEKISVVSCKQAT